MTKYLVQRPSSMRINEYHSKQINNIKNFESNAVFKIQDYLKEEKIEILLNYANSLTRQYDFGNNDRIADTKKAIDIYMNVYNSDLPDKYKVYALNEIYTSFIQSDSDISTIVNLFTQESVISKSKFLGLGDSPQNLNSYMKSILYQNLLIDKEVESNNLINTKIAIARISMQDYINQMLFRTQIDLSKPEAAVENEKIKKEFSDKIFENYEKYKIVESNTLKPDSYYAVESAYLMAWSLNRAAVYSDNKILVNESYQLFDDTIGFINSLKSTNDDVWHLSILTKIFYASAVLGSNKDAYIDPEIAENRNRALTILSELSSPNFMTDKHYYGTQNYLRAIKYSDMDWVTTLLLLSKYDEGLNKNLKALGWKV